MQKHRTNACHFFSNGVKVGALKTKEVFTNENVQKNQAFGK